MEITIGLFDCCPDVSFVWPESCSDLMALDRRTFSARKYAGFSMQP